MAKPGQHVIPTGDKWAVRKAGSARTTKVFGTKKEAVAHAREIAKHQATELYIHGKNGRIQQRDSYGHDPHPPKG
jgi:uncharacterized protein YdaT